MKKQQKEMSEETKNISEQLLKMMEKEEEVRRDAANAEQVQMKLLQDMMARLQKLEKGQQATNFGIAGSYKNPMGNVGGSMGNFGGM